MFGLFKKKPVVQPLDPNDPYSTGDVFLDHWDGVTDIDEHIRRTAIKPGQPQTTTEDIPFDPAVWSKSCPFVLKYHREFPYTVLTEICVYLHYMDAVEPATEMVERQLSIQGRTVTPEEKKRLIDECAEMIAFDTALREDEITLAEKRAYDQALNDVLFNIRLDGIRDAIDRSAVAANALDLAKRHPFLVGFFGAGLLQNMKRN